MILSLSWNITHIDLSWNIPYLFTRHINYYKNIFTVFLFIMHKIEKRYEELLEEQKNKKIKKKNKKIKTINEKNRETWNNRKN